MLPMNQLAMSLIILQKTLFNLTFTPNDPHVHVDTGVMTGVPAGSVAEILIDIPTDVCPNDPEK